jgi:protein-S-isoprenylcysteine O-methyltransferase Ste14
LRGRDAPAQARGVNLRALELKLPPLAQLALAALAMWGVARAGWAADFRLPSLRGVAVAAALTGIAAEAGAIVSFRRAQTTMNPLTPGKATHLVTTGIYRWTRNPMYVGLLLWLVAWALFLGHALAWGGLPLFVLTMNRLQIAPEERAMTALFGAEYAAYRARVRRWV